MTQPYFNQKPSSVWYHALLGFYLCQSRTYEFKKHLLQIPSKIIVSKKKIYSCIFLRHKNHLFLLATYKKISVFAKAQKEKSEKSDLAKYEINRKKMIRNESLEYLDVVRTYKMKKLEEINFK